MTATPKLTRAAVHEAGHVVVGYALGRRVTLVRMGSQAVPEDHPHPELAGATASGETRFGPDIVDEINRRSNANLPLEPEHVEWLRAELVTCFAGGLAEVAFFGDSNDVAKLGDNLQGARIVRMLGITSDADGGEARLNRAGNAADTIVTELRDCVCLVAARLSDGPVEFDEPALEALLDESGVHRGSHRHLLDGLA